MYYLLEEYLLTYPNLFTKCKFVPYFALLISYCMGEIGNQLCRVRSKYYIVLLFNVPTFYLYYFVAYVIFLFINYIYLFHYYLVYVFSICTFLGIHVIPINSHVGHITLVNNNCYSNGSQST